MQAGLQLERVQKISGGRVHLIPQVPGEGGVTTLCNQRFAAGTFRETEAEADCRNCLRRKDDPARISSAFFQSDAGGELLRLSLDQARQRRQGWPPAPPAAEEPPAAEPSPAPPPAPPRIPELRSRTPLRQTFENVFVSPAGVILRLSRDGALSEVAFNGPFDLRRRRGRAILRIGDVEIELGGE